MSLDVYAHIIKQLPQCPMKILNVAEKPSVAKSIAKILSNEIQTRRGMHKFCPNIYFKSKDDMIFTSVLGHLNVQNFTVKYKWTEIDPRILFYERIEKSVKEDFQNIKKNIEREASKVDKVIIWTDCDREGENIAMQIANIVRDSRSNLEIKRARFSGITLNEINYALENLSDINIFESNAVDARMELDLRIGSAFTILQTICLQSLLLEKQIVSFGPCQIPTLGFVVERSDDIENFTEEDNFSLEFTIIKNNVSNVFKWDRGYLFDKNCVIHFYDFLKGKKALIISKDEKENKILKPLPLRTVEFQKHCTSIFKVSGQKLMEVAESLYNKGYISYPRTETDSFAPKFNFRSILNKLSGDDELNKYVDPILKNLKYPRKGKNNDMAHSPIYPLKPGNGLTGLDRSIYDYVTRRFLAGLCENAISMETTYKTVIDGEIFILKGMKIIERNFLDVFKYEQHKETFVSDFVVNTLLTNDLKLVSSKTSPPDYLTESELIALMDKNGIGTDATIHEHIQKIQDRKYAKKEGVKIKPERLGTALIKAYNILNLDFSKPVLRKNLECNLKKVCENTLDHERLIETEIEQYVELFDKLKNSIDIFKDTIHSIILKFDDKENIGPGKTFSKKRNIDNNIVKKDVLLKNEHDNISVICQCRKSAIIKIVTAGKNKGKRYLACGYNPSKCSYFKWYDPSVENSRINAEELPMENYKNHKKTRKVVNNSGENENVLCYCNLESQKFVSKTEKNNGREFFKCKKLYGQCKFFKWADMN